VVSGAEPKEVKINGLCKESSGEEGGEEGHQEGCQEEKITAG
jgi:hypothetical protein